MAKSNWKVQSSWKAPLKNSSNRGFPSHGVPTHPSHGWPWLSLETYCNPMGFAHWNLWFFGIPAIAPSWQPTAQRRPSHLHRAKPGPQAQTANDEQIVREMLLCICFQEDFGPIDDLFNKMMYTILLSPMIGFARRKISGGFWWFCAYWYSNFR